MKKFLSILAILAAVVLMPSCQKELPDAIKNIDVSQGDKTPSSTSKEKYLLGIPLSAFIMGGRCA